MFSPRSYRQKFDSLHTPYLISIKLWLGFMEHLGGHRGTKSRACRGRQQTQYSGNSGMSYLPLWVVTLWWRGQYEQAIFYMWKVYWCKFCLWHTIYYDIRVVCAGRSPERPSILHCTPVSSSNLAPPWTGLQSRFSCRSLAAYHSSSEVDVARTLLGNYEVSNK